MQHIQSKTMNMANPEHIESWGELVLIITYFSEGWYELLGWN